MQEVSFATHDPVVLADMLRPSVQDRPIRGKGLLYRPGGSAKRPGSAGFPAIVLLEGLGGLKPQRELRYAADLAADGYVVLVVDTFATRNAAAYGDTKRALTVTEAMMLADAFGGLAFLRRQPAVDPARIAVMGFSYGGMVAVLAAYEQIRRLMAPRQEGFAAHAAFYGCSVPRLEDPRTSGAPVLMLLGRRDRNVCLDRARAITGDLERGGSPVERHVFDAWHQWDGNDVERRFVRHALNRLRIRVDRDNVARQEGTGIPMLGPLTRKLIIGLGVDLGGYHIQRDARVEAAGYAALLRFLTRAMPGADTAWTAVRAAE